MSTIAFDLDKDVDKDVRFRSGLLELKVNNHPGVMSHICGLFARRAFNVEKILCLPMGGGERSRIWLTVNKDCRLGQIVKQLMKLEDVLEVRDAGENGDVFERIKAWVQEDEGGLLQGDGKIASLPAV